MIPLTQGRLALVDDSDYKRVSRFKWHAVRLGKSIYAARRVPNHRREFLHNFVLRHRRKVDHRNRDGLDNQKNNLRECTHAQNLRNRGVWNHSSKFKGVSWNRSSSKWTAYISNGSSKKVHLGYFSSEREAAKAYDLSAVKIFGDFALTNQQLGLL